MHYLSFYVSELLLIMGIAGFIVTFCYSQIGGKMTTLFFAIWFVGGVVLFSVWIYSDFETKRILNEKNSQLDSATNCIGMDLLQNT